MGTPFRLASQARALVSARLTLALRVCSDSRSALGELDAERRAPIGTRSRRIGGSRAGIRISRASSTILEHDERMGMTRERSRAVFDAAPARRCARARGTLGRSAAVTTTSGPARCKAARASTREDGTRLATRCAPGTRCAAERDAASPNRTTAWSPTATTTATARCAPSSRRARRATRSISAISAAARSRSRPARSRCASTSVTLDRTPIARARDRRQPRRSRVPALRRRRFRAARSHRARTASIARPVPSRHRRLHRIGGLRHARSQHGDRLLFGRRRRVRRRDLRVFAAHVVEHAVAQRRIRRASRQRHRRVRRRARSSTRSTSSTARSPATARTHRFNPPLHELRHRRRHLTVRGGLVIGSTIDSNFAYGRGGGLATFDNILVRNSTMSGNVARTVGGGGLFVRFPARARRTQQHDHGQRRDTRAAAFCSRRRTHRCTARSSPATPPTPLGAPISRRADLTIDGAEQSDRLGLERRSRYRTRHVRGDPGLHAARVTTAARRARMRSRPTVAAIDAGNNACGSAIRPARYRVCPRRRHSRGHRRIRIRRDRDRHPRRIGSDRFALGRVAPVRAACVDRRTCIECTAKKIPKLKRRIRNAILMRD